MDPSPVLLESNSQVMKAVGETQVEAVTYKPKEDVGDKYSPHPPPPDAKQSGLPTS